MVTQVRGKWDTAIQAPGNCSAAGHYSVNAGGAGLFVAREVSGRWGAARAVARHAGTAQAPERQHRLDGL